MLVQLPSNFQIDAAMDGVHASSSGHEVDLTNESSSSSSSETTDHFTQRKIRKLEPGRIGTVQILESGRMLIKLPGSVEEPEPRVYEASEGLRVNFLQQLAVIEVSDNNNNSSNSNVNADNHGDGEDDNNDQSSSSSSSSNSNRRGRSRSSSTQEEKKPGPYLSHLHESTASGTDAGASGRTRSRSRSGSVGNAMDVQGNSINGNSSSRVVVKKENGSRIRGTSRSNAEVKEDDKDKGKEKDKEINGNLFLLKKVQRKLVFTERI